MLLYYCTRSSRFHCHLIKKVAGDNIKRFWEVGEYTEYDIFQTIIIIIIIIIITLIITNIIGTFWIADLGHYFLKLKKTVQWYWLYPELSSSGRIFYNSNSRTFVLS
jgi:hypothetical protein